MNRHFSKKDIQRAQRHINRCSASLAIRGMEIKTTMRYHFTLVRMAIINKSTTKTNKQTSAGKVVEYRKPLYIVGWNADWCSHNGKQYGISSEN